MEMDAARWIVWGTVLMMLVAVAWYVISKLRGLLYERPVEPREYLGTFQELRERGLLQEEEFQRLKKTLGSGVRPESAVAREPREGKPGLEHGPVGGKNGGDSPAAPAEEE